MTRRLVVLFTLAAGGCGSSADAGVVCTTLANAAAALATKAAGCGAAANAVPPPGECATGNVNANCAADANAYLACVNALPACTLDAGVAWVVQEINCQRALATAPIDCNGNGT